MFKEQQASVPNSGFFPIPIPNFLLSSFNIPEPIIHPPGTNPYSFLNPNPPGDDRLEPLPVLDVDPSAASRNEIITMITDLTVSEHAGGTLSEPTMVSTTSHSPAKSEVVTQQTVNDVIVTKIHSENTRSILCDVCNITCNSEDIFKRHKEGKKHLKNMQKLTVSSAIMQEMRPPVANATLDQEAEKKHDLLQNEASGDSLFFCDIPDVGCNNQNIFTTHLEGEKHAAQVTSGPLCRDELPSPTSVSTPLVQPSSSGTQKAQDKLNIRQTVWCEVCKVSCSSNKTLGKHILGKKHLKTLKNSEKILVPPSTPIASLATTPISKPVENSKSTEGEVVDSEESIVSRDISGKQHLTNLQESEKLPDCPSSLIASVATPQSTGLVEHAKSTEGEIVNPEEGKPAWCELCKVSCSSNVLSIHVSGKKHLQNLEKSEKIPGLPSVPGSPSNPIASVRTPPSTGPVEIIYTEEGKSAWCRLCKASCSTNILSGHLSGKKHLKNLQNSEKIPGSPSTPNASVTTPPTGPVEQPKSTKGEVVNSKEGKSAWCDLCGISCNSDDVLNKHISGKKHQKNMKKSEELTEPSPAPATEGSLQNPMNEKGEVVILENRKRKAKSSLASHEDLDTKRQKMIKEGAESGSVTCTLCNVVCESPMAFTSHLAGQKHSAMVLKQVKA